MHPVILGTIVGECYGTNSRLIIKLVEYTKHMNEKDLSWTLPSVRDIRTLLLHCSVTPNLRLKESFQTFAAQPVDETRQLTSQNSPRVEG